ncbi:MAG: ATP synthase F1 subunit epsilon [Oscillospiraceae bacterium]|jgi:F-type H+-transporting ATPase subunit epsilon|nr:ATP synthase F1 subunit epsilon [Oscillospiraceae bacterium]
MSSFHLTILTPERAFFEGSAQALVFPTVDGLYGVLAGHQPELVILVEGLLSIDIDGVTRQAAASDGFVTILPESVTVILQTVEWPEDIDRRRAEEARREAEEALRQRQSQQEFVLARSMLARAMVRLRVTRGAGGHESQG